MESFLRWVLDQTCCPNHKLSYLCSNASSKKIHPSRISRKEGSKGTKWFTMQWPFANILVIQSVQRKAWLKFRDRKTSSEFWWDPLCFFSTFFCSNYTAGRFQTREARIACRGRLSVWRQGRDTLSMVPMSTRGSGKRIPGTYLRSQLSLPHLLSRAASFFSAKRPTKAPPSNCQWPVWSLFSLRKNPGIFIALALPPAQAYPQTVFFFSCGLLPKASMAKEPQVEILTCHTFEKQVPENLSISCGWNVSISWLFSLQKTFYLLLLYKTCFKLY